MRDLAKEFGLSVWRVRQILEHGGGDPFGGGGRSGSRTDLSLERVSVAQLEAERAHLRASIAASLTMLWTIEDELESRNVDRILGLA